MLSPLATRWFPEVVDLFIIAAFLAWGGYNLKSELDHARARIAELTQERDTANTRLAPFLAEGVKIFSNAPADKRLELLLDRFVSESLKQPALEVLTMDGLLSGHVFEMDGPGPGNFGAIIVKNVGDKRTDPLSMAILVPAAFGNGWSKAPTSDTNFVSAFAPINASLPEIGAHDERAIFDWLTPYCADVTNAICKLQISYGGDHPAEVTFRLHRRR